MSVEQLEFLIRFLNLELKNTMGATELTDKKKMNISQTWN